MWHNSDYKEAFEGYAPTPPESVWHDIAMNLASIKPISETIVHVKNNSFNSAQKFTLIAASIASIFLTGFMSSYIEDKPSSNYSESIQTAPLIVSKTFENQDLKPNSELAYIKSNSNPIFRAKSSSLNKKEYHKSIVSNLPNEAIPFKEEILELADLDIEIEKLAQEIALTEESIEYTATKPQLETLNLSKLELENAALLSSFNSKNNKSIEPTDQSNRLSFLDNFLSKTYITPYFGTSYTQIFYQGTTNSPFFSQNAEFTGKLGYNFGIQTGYQFNKKWSFESGIAFGQYIQNFSERLNNNTLHRNGVMYIDQLDIPIMARYTIPLSRSERPISLSLKTGFIYNSVIKYQVNYADQDLSSLKSDNSNIDADKRLYNSLQLGFIGGFDLDAFVTKKISLNFSLLNSFVSQLENFPTFSNDRKKPLQNSSIFSIGTKFRF